MVKPVSYVVILLQPVCQVLEFVSERQTLSWNSNMCSGVTESDQSYGGIRMGTFFDSPDQGHVCDISESRPRTVVPDYQPGAARSAPSRVLS